MVTLFSEQAGRFERWKISLTVCKGSRTSFQGVKLPGKFNQDKSATTKAARSFFQYEGLNRPRDLYYLSTA